MEQNKHEAMPTSRFLPPTPKQFTIPVFPPTPQVKQFCVTLEIKSSQCWCGYKNFVIFLTTVIISVIMFRSEPHKTVILSHLNGQQQTVKPLKVVLSLKYPAELHLWFVRFISNFLKDT